MPDNALFVPTEAVLRGDTADVYFHRTKEILAAAEINPVVTMEVFAGQHGLLCGIREVRALLERVCSSDAVIESLSDGDAIARKEVVLRIRDRYQSFCLYETAYLGYLSSGTGWATAARAAVAAAEGVPVIAFGARHIHPNVVGPMEYAAIIGGCQACASVIGAEMAGLAPSGTMPHALVLVLGDTVRAAQLFHATIDLAVNRVVLVDTFHDEVEEALRVGAALGDDLWGVRLDTPSERGGVTPALVAETRARLDGAGLGHVKIVISGGLSVERIARFRAEGAPVDIFGVGSAISGAPAIDFTADIKEIAGHPVAKRGRIPGITPTTRLMRWKQ
ncbi:MAG: nicotinate phosphoribosyltransferase [Chloroflexota bacterium]|nr:nicotinate phosphoribosyltransferase [Chloroflexota bacterium]MDQ6905887.1 nicotinate phosphoribosyltransferase [Chloroflexota bacterium]